MPFVYRERNKGKIEMNKDTRKRSRNERFTPIISANTASRITYYCKLTKKNRNKFVEECINAQLDILENEYYQSLSKDELIELAKDVQGRR